MEDAEVLRRNNLSQKRKTRNAIAVIEKMVEAKEIDKLWRDFHITLKAAREKMVCPLSPQCISSGNVSNLDCSIVTSGIWKAR